MNGILATLKALGTVRLVLMGVVAAVLLTAFVAISTRLAAPNMSLLFSDLTLKDSSQIVARLEEMNVSYELRAGGAQIYVPDDKALRLRMTMAADGLPTGGSVGGYEQFDKSETLSVSSFMQNVNLQRAIEGELSRTIRSLDDVRSARVHLVLPRRQLFSRERAKPSASITLQLVGNKRLGADRVVAVQNLVAAAVPELEAGAVTIVDTRGRLLTEKPAGPENGQANNAKIQADLEDKWKAKVQGMLERIVGIGNARVELNADLDFDRITTNTETFDPDGQVTRSSQSTEESKSETEGGSDNVSVTQNLPQAELGAGPGGNSVSTRTEETTNFEISKTIKTQIHESGGVKRLTISVAVNNVVTRAPDGKITSTPRSDEEMQKIDALVKSAIGFDETRGDKVDVVNLAFKLPDLTGFEGQEDLSGASLSKADYFRIGEILALVIVAGLIILLVLRPLIAALPAQRSTQPGAPALELPASVPRLQGMTAEQIRESPEVIRALEAGEISQEDLDKILAAAPERFAMPPESDADGIDIARIEGRVKASSIRKIGKLVDKHPEEAVAIMRSWMYQDA